MSVASWLACLVLGLAGWGGSRAVVKIIKWFDGGGLAQWLNSLRWWT
jgi:hypothetical protein